MAGQQYSYQVVASMLEQVNKKFAYFMRKKESAFMQMFNKQSEKHNVSAFYDSTNTLGTTAAGSILAWRVPVILSRGGDYGAVNLDGGDLGTGSMQQSAFMAFGTFESDIAYQVPTRATISTKSDAQAIANALQMAIGSAIEEQALYNEIGFFQDGTGILATSTTTSSSPGTTATYNLETAAFSYIRLRGQNTLVDVYDSGNVLRAKGARISNINFSLTAPTVTITGATSYTPANGDQLAFPNIGAGTVGTTTLAAGSWRNGLYTFNTTSTSGSLGGLSYANAYELACNTVNGQSGFFTPSLLLSGRTQLVQRRDDEAYSGIIGVCHQAQAASWYLQGVTISNWFRGAKDSMIDIVPKYGTTFDAGGITHHTARYANKSRVDWIAPKNFGWTQFMDPGFFTSPEGQRTFVARSTSTGNPQAAFQFYALNTRQLYSVDPGCSVVIYSLAIPTGQ